MYKISDFKIARSLLISASKATNTSFVDLEVEFDKENGFVGTRGGKIIAGNPTHFTSTIFNIVWTYLSNFREINGCEVFVSDKQKEMTFTLIVNFLKKIAYSNVGEEQESVRTTLYHCSPVWLIMKDVVCPLYDKNINNVKVLVYNSPFVDASFFQKSKEESELIFLNSDITYDPYKMACLLIEAIKAHDLKPNDVAEDVLNSELRYVLEGVIKLEFKEEEKVKDFMSIFSNLTGVEQNLEKIISGNKMVTAQSANSVFDNGANSSWWFLGLIEQMLEPTRGQDWDVYENLEPLHQELRNRIDIERKKAGADGVPYEMLLRIKDGEIDPKSIKLIEKALGSDRIW